MLQIEPVLAFGDNYVWVLSREGRPGAAVVDPGDAAPVLAHLDSKGLALEAVLVTHHHPDHVSGIPELVARRPAPVYGPAREQIPGMDRPLAEGERLSVPGAGLDLQVLETPGHTAGHLCYLGHGWLFSGDTLFTAGCGRLFEGTPEQMHRSLTRLARLPEETLVYCGHEYTLSNLRFALAVEPENPDLLSRCTEAEDLRSRGLPTVPAPIRIERQTNPFLRCDVPVVREAAQRHASDRRLTTPADVFTVLRDWKNNF
jgi:hydroxyacylglutathione hydrolase